MPDWITHIAAAYILCTILGFKYKQFNTSNTVIAMVGALIPDIIKINIILNYLGYNFWNLLTPIHLPIGSFIIAGMISLLFEEKKTVFLFLSLGVVTHYALDVLMVGSGMYLLISLLLGPLAIRNDQHNRLQCYNLSTDSCVYSLFAITV